MIDVDITEKLILPSDVELTRVTDINQERLTGIAFDKDDWILTRPGSRSPSSVVSDALAQLLDQFRGGTRIVDAVIAYGKRAEKDSQELLDEVWPPLNRFIQAKWLVPEGSLLATPLNPWYSNGANLAGLTLLRCLRVREDSQVYQARSSAGEYLAVKILDERSTPNAGALLSAEACILQHLGGSPSPAFIDLTAQGSRHVLMMEWCIGVPITAAARPHYEGPAKVARCQIHQLLVSLLESYTSIHSSGVLHGDVHPENAIVDSDGRTRLIDFGLAQFIGKPREKLLRGGVPEYMDPELAQALLDDGPRPETTIQSEQYSLAALCYKLATGCAYLNFPKERGEFLKAVVELTPLPFTAHGTPAWPELEEILVKALSKDPALRFTSTSDMATRIAQLNILPKLPVPEMSRSSACASAPFVAQVERRLHVGQRIYSQGVAAGPRATIMTGAAGIAYYLLRIAILSASPDLLAAADQWTERAGQLAAHQRGIYDPSSGATEGVIGKISPFHTDAGIALMRGLVAEARNDLSGLVMAVRAFIQLTGRPCAAIDPTLGCASVLIGSALLARALQNTEGKSDITSKASSDLDTHADKILRYVWEKLDRCGPVGHESSVRYTGVAHGWAGLLYATLMWSEVAGAPLPASVERRLFELASLCLPEGRGLVWPIEGRSTYREVMRGWCHGAPGHVHLWNAAHRILGSREYYDMAIKAAWSTFDFAGGGASICCGEAGRVFALLSMYRHSGDPAWLYRAKERAMRAVSQVNLNGDRAFENSLYKGELGVALAIRELEYPEDALHPVFEVAPRI
ncbi:Serine/threonine-protein kinase StkP [Pelotomaculum schinkii]|uniref:Serine/threonine-protein kinase StkP n=1 Tax=Pelotomaculum schinkii TaxID=78350 RepID=A0A4Y7RA34_9FIRM|nr:lanthionine synthetase LanC family protein [Pelotomaculum schinkii]TEB05569.1 Serine/threonine-protein kinase StkP [Pelotomaculum schinkii]